MKELRQIKLALIDSDFMVDRVKSILNTLDTLLGRLEPHRNDNYKDYTFYINSYNEIIIEKYDKFQWVWINYMVWNTFSFDFDLTYYEIQEIFTWYIERSYKIIARPDKDWRKSKTVLIGNTYKI